MSGHPVPELSRGWLVLLATMVGNGAGLAALPFFAISSFMAPLQASFGWSRPAIGMAATVLAGGVFLTASLVGRLCDRFGARRVAMVSIVLYAADFLLMASGGPDIRWFYASFALLALVGGATTSIAYSRMVAMWFARRRGLALGIMASGGGVTALLLPMLLNGVIAAYGWRIGWVVCAAIAALPLPLVFALGPERAEHRAGCLGSAFGMTMRKAVRTRSFWLLAVAIGLSISAAGGLVVHLKPMLQDLGQSAAVAARVAGLLGLGILVGRLGTGYLLDRIDAPKLAAGVMLVAAAGFTVLAAHVPGLAFLGVLLVGFTLGAEGDLLAFLTARCFGLRSYSEIFGWLFGIMSLGSASGPAIVGLLYHWDGGYRRALWLFAAQCLIASGAFFFVGPAEPALQRSGTVPDVSTGKVR